MACSLYTAACRYLRSVGRPEDFRVCFQVTGYRENLIPSPISMQSSKSGTFRSTPPKFRPSLNASKSTRDLQSAKKDSQHAPAIKGSPSPSRDPSNPFRLAYDRSDLPVRIEHTSKGPKLRWTRDLASIDYEYTLPIFCEGLRETKFPHDFMAEEGAQQMIHGHPEQVHTAIPYMIQPLKTALRSNDPKIMIKVLKILQQIATEVPDGGPALVPYYRQLLPVLGRYKTKNINLGDGVEYGQWRNQNLADLIEETLQILEIHGGTDAFINIRYVIPLYESCIGGR